MPLKKYLCTRLLPLLFPLLLSPTLAETIEENHDEINPEILELIQLKPLPDDFFERNLYVAQLGFEYPHDNYLEIAEKVIRNNQQNLMRFTDNGRKTIELLEQVDIDSINNYLKNEEKYLRVELPTEIDFDALFPCLQYHQLEGCIEKTVNNRDHYKKSFQQNKTLIKRYQTLSRDFDFVDEPDFTVMSALPSYQNFRKLTLLHLAKAIINFTDGNVDTGLNILINEHKELSIYLHEKSQSNLVGIVINSARLQDLDQTLDQLLTDGYLDQYLNDPRVKALFEPRNEASKQSVINALYLEMLTPYIFDAEIALTPQPKLSDQEELVLTFMCQQRDTCPLDQEKYEKLSNEYPQFTKEVEEWNAEQFEHYFKEQQIDEYQIAKYLEMVSIETLNQRYSTFKKFFALIEGDFTESDIKRLDEEAEHLKPSSLFWNSAYSLYINYLYRIEEQNNYHNLLYLKYRIKRDQIADDAIPQFLESMGELAKNRITKEPFSWDAEKRTLSTPLHSPQTTPVGMDYSKTKSITIKL